MKKLLLLIIALVVFIPSFCLAAEPVIKSDTRTFNPLTGIYDLQGNVYVQIPANDSMLTITGDQTMVSLYKLEVHGQGNITLVYDDLKFHCDKVDVYNKNRTAYVTGNCNFVNGAVSINADSGSFNWKTKLASFEGNVKVNGVPQKETITYNVITQSFVGTKPSEKNGTTIKAAPQSNPQPAAQISDDAKTESQPVKKAA